MKSDPPPPGVARSGFPDGCVTVGPASLPRTTGTAGGHTGLGRRASPARRPPQEALFRPGPISPDPSNWPLTPAPPTPGGLIFFAPLGPEAADAAHSHSHSRGSREIVSIVPATLFPRWPASDFCDGLAWLNDYTLLHSDRALALIPCGVLTACWSGTSGGRTREARKGRGRVSGGSTCRPPFKSIRSFQGGPK